MNRIDHTTTVLRYLKDKTDSVILFYSAGGKDSTVLLDLCAKNFKHVYCVYMYFIKNLQHNASYFEFIKKYQNVELFQYPHFSTSDNISANDLTFLVQVKKYHIKLEDIVFKARKDTGAEWCIFGWKKADSIYRKVILDTYLFDAISEKTKKAYPLSLWNKQNVVDYITIKNLPKPLAYGNSNSQGMGLNKDFLVWLRKFHPSDLEKVLKTFPLAGKILFEYDYRKQNSPVAEI